jgi:hypothetical protein
MTNKLSEYDLVIKFCKSLQNEGKTFAVEVPFFSKSIDLVFTDTNGDFYAIEFKLRNWRQAIRQAKYYMLGAEFTYICIPKNICNKNVEREIILSNCGLFVFDEESEEFVLVREPMHKQQKARFLIEKGFTYALKNNNYEHLLSLT